MGTGSIQRVALVPWLVAGLVATFACGSSKSQTSVSDDTAGGDSALGGTDGGGSGGASATAGQGGDVAKGGTGGTLTVGGGGGRPGSGGTQAGAGGQAVITTRWPVLVLLLLAPVSSLRLSATLI